MNRHHNENAYYYRFNAPGEAQATGKVSEEEKAIFLKLVSEGVDYKWGIFSKRMPGRVGYQCSNFYRQLIKNGELKDENYIVENGKLKFVRPKNKKRVRVEHDPSKAPVTQLAVRTSSKRKSAGAPKTKKKKQQAKEKVK